MVRPPWREFLPYQSRNPIPTTESLVHEWKVVDRQRHQAAPIEQASWADWDKRGLLIYARGGQVWATLPEHFPEEARCLADFNDRTPDPAPTLARAWPA